MVGYDIRHEIYLPLNVFDFFNHLVERVRVNRLLFSIYDLFSLDFVLLLILFNKSHADPGQLAINIPGTFLSLLKDIVGGVLRFVRV